MSKNDFEYLEKLDQRHLRFLIGSHAKAPIEMLYLESGAIPIRFIVSMRIMIYLQTLLKRDDKEVTKQILLAKIEHSVKGDFVQLIKDDFEAIGVPINYELFKQLPADVYKQFVKNKVRSAALEHLLQIKENHSKVKNIKYTDLQTQPYLLSDLFSNKDTEMLFNLRAKTDKNFKENFPSLNMGKVNCPLFCWELDETPPMDS